MDDVQLHAEVGSEVWQVIAVIHTATANRPDRWTFTLASSGSDPPAPGAAVTLTPGGARPAARLTVLTAPTMRPVGAYRVTATRLPAGSLAAVVPPLLQGGADQIIGHLTKNWCEIGKTALAALQRVTVHSLRRPGWVGAGAESIGQCVRWLVRHLAGERGVILRITVDDTGLIRLVDPCSDPSTKSDPIVENRKIFRGRSDPFDPRPTRSASNQTWIRGQGDNRGWGEIWPEWLEAAAVVGDSQFVVRRFRARWYAVGKAHGR
jgi:hypothetical protein